MDLIAVLMLVFLVALSTTWAWLRLANSRHWFDLPNHRSSHARPTPKSGGMGFVVAFSLFVLLLYGSDRLTLVHLQWCMLGLILAITGLIDDFRNLGIGIRIGIQVLVCTVAVFLLDTLPVVAFPWGSLSAGWLMSPLLVLALVWLVNLYNFMDGIDGLAALEAVFFCLALAGFGSVANDAQVTALALGLAVAVSGFLYFNLPPARLFMGDAGSNYLGFLLGISGVMAIASQVINVWTLLVLLGVFIVDATTTLIVRMSSGAVWYHSHRSHAYQRAALRFGSHGMVVAGIGLINLFWLLPLAWFATRHAEAGLLITSVAWLPLFLLERYFRKAAPRYAKVQANHMDPAVKSLRNGRMK